MEIFLFIFYFLEIDSGGIILNEESVNIIYNYKQILNIYLLNIQNLLLFLYEWSKQHLIFYTLLSSPLFGAIFLFFISKYNINLIKKLSLYFSIFTFIISIICLFRLDIYYFNFQQIQHFNWFSYFNIYLSFGLDGISLLFIVLTTFLMVICILASWEVVFFNVKFYFITLLLTEFLLIILFSSIDLLMFYVFFESILIPMFFIVGVWGSRNRRIHAAYQFFLYTLLGSVLMLLALLFIHFHAGTTNYQILTEYSFSFYRQIFLWLAFFASFAIKIPMFPFHIWLPEAHVEAPTAGSVLLAGILLKLGSYGFLRFSIPLFIKANFFFIPFIYVLSIIAIVYASFTTIRQIDLKKIIAYSSVVHMNFALLGLFTLNLQSIAGSYFLMLSHGIVSGGLFLCVGILYDRYHTRILKYYNGLNTYMPIFAIIFLILTLANVGFPGTSSFIGEFLIVIGVFQFNTIAIFFGCFSLILGAVYAFWLYNRIFFGKLQYNYLSKFCDINKREFMILFPLIFLIFLAGIYPNGFFSIFLLPLNNICSILQYSYL